MTAEDFAAIDFIQNASPAQVYAWYKERPRERSPITWEIDCLEAQEIIDYLAYRRDDPLIDAALSNYGFTSPVLRRVYRRSGLSRRVTLCANAELISGRVSRVRRQNRGRWSFLNNLLESGGDDEVRALTSSPNHVDHFYERLIRSSPFRKGEDKADLPTVSAERFGLILAGLARNVRMQTARADTSRADYRDGFSDIEYALPFRAAWKLAEELPTEPLWAGLLADLYERLPQGQFSEEQVPGVLERWASPKNETGRDDEYRDYDPYRSIRASIIAHHLKFDPSWKDHDDYAYREAFLQRVDPIGEEWSELHPGELGLDPYTCFERLTKNQELWRSRRGRDLIWNEARSADSFEIRDVSGRYKRLESEVRARHPDWFNWEDEAVKDDIDLGLGHEPDVSELLMRVIDLSLQTRRSLRALRTVVYLLAVGLALVWFNTR